MYTWKLKAVFTCCNTAVGVIGHISFLIQKWAKNFIDSYSDVYNACVGPNKTWLI
jgi:hypothetical protein